MDNKKLPTRKSQRIPGYDYGTEGAYFITLCTNNFEKLLGEVNFEGNAVVELNEIGGVCKSILEGIDETAIYIIMPNHIHAIFEIYDKKTTIPKIITKFKSIVTRKVGKSI